MNTARLVEELLLIVRVVVAAVLSGVIGWERERAGKPAGLRTYTVVGVASALFVTLVDVMAQRYRGYGEGLRVDPAHGIAAIATGVGFLGAGIIFVAQGEQKVIGLTTAALIWATAAVGAAAGLEHYVLALGATVLLLIAMRVLVRLERPH